MKSKKLAMALATVLAFSSVLSACGDEKPSDSSTASVSSAADENGRAMEGNLYLEGLPLVKEQETFSILVDDTNSQEASTREMVKLLEEQTNVKVNWMVYPYEVAAEKKNILLNSGDYPDALGGWIVDKVVKYGSQEKIYIPLEDLFKKYAPNIEKVLELENIRRDMTLPDGHIYSPPYVVTGEPEFTYTQWINKKWLDNLGLKMPTTTDELYEVLKAFKEKDANGNGDPNDEIPFSSRHDRAYNWFSYFGTSVRDTQFLLIDGELVYGANADYYKDGINYYAKLYKEGLMDPEIFTQDMNNYSSKGKAKDAVYGVFNAYYPYDMSPGIGEDGLGIRNDEYVPLPALTSPNCSKPIIERSSNGMNIFPNQFVITDKAKNPATIVRWLNNVYELENSLQIQWGKFGVTSEKKADGTYKVLPKNEITGAPGYSEWIWSLPRYVPADYLSKLEDSPLNNQNKAQNKAMDEVWNGKASEVLPVLWLTDEQTSSISTIETDIGNYVKEKRAQWITGVADVNKEWDDYKAQLNKYGLEKMQKVYRDAYTEILNKK